MGGERGGWGGGGVGGGGGVDVHHVYVGGFAGGGVEVGDCAGDPVTPVAALGYWMWWL